MQYSTINVLGLLAATAVAAPGAENCGDNFEYSPGRCNNCPYTGENLRLESDEYAGMCQRDCPAEKRVCRGANGEGLFGIQGGLNGLNGINNGINAQRFVVQHNEQVSCSKNVQYNLDVAAEDCGEDSGYAGQQCLKVRYLNAQGIQGDIADAGIQGIVKKMRKRHSGDNVIDGYNAGINSYGNSGFNREQDDSLTSFPDNGLGLNDQGFNNGFGNGFAGVGAEDVEDEGLIDNGVVNSDIANADLYNNGFNGYDNGFDNGYMNNGYGNYGDYGVDNGYINNGYGYNNGYNNGYINNGYGNYGIDNIENIDSVDDADILAIQGGISSCNLGVYDDVQDVYEPEQLNFNDYCAGDSCSVPADRLPGYPDLCGRSMYLAVGNDACYNDAGLNPEGYRQATKYVEVRVDCAGGLDQEGLVSDYAYGNYGNYGNYGDYADQGIIDAEQGCDDYCCCP